MTDLQARLMWGAGCARLLIVDFDFAEHDLVRPGLAACVGDCFGRAAAKRRVVDQQANLRGGDRIEVVPENLPVAEEAI